MSTVSLAQPTSTPAHLRDPYRFGDGEEPWLRAGTLGWSSFDLLDPQIRQLWDQGRYEIIDGVLTLMPPAFFAGGRCVDNLKYLLRNYCERVPLKWDSASEVEIKVTEERLLRADTVCIFGDDLELFRNHALHTGTANWAMSALVLGPSLIIESVSQGHEPYDRKTKRRWYAELGAKRYWIVDVFARSLECLVLDGAAFREEAAGRDEQTVVVPSLPGLTLPLKDVWGG